MTYSLFCEHCLVIELRLLKFIRIKININIRYCYTFGNCNNGNSLIVYMYSAYNNMCSVLELNEHEITTGLRRLHCSIHLLLLIVAIIILRIQQVVYAICILICRERVWTNPAGTSIMRIFRICKCVGI